MSELALLMTGVLTTGQPSPPILPEQPLVQLYNGVEKSTRGQLSQLVPTAQITPPEFMQPNGTILAAPSASTIKRNTGVQTDVDHTGGNTLNQISSQVDAKKLHQVSTEALPLAVVRRNSATENFRLQQRSATKIADKPQIIDEQDSDNKMLVTKSQNLTSPLPTLEFGDSGTSVRALQRLLMSNGYGVQLDGNFGALTEIAVRSFQSRRNIEADGIVGQKTWDELTK